MFKDAYSLRVVIIILLAAILIIVAFMAARELFLNKEKNPEEFRCGSLYAMDGEYEWLSTEALHAAYTQAGQSYSSDGFYIGYSGFAQKMNVLDIYPSGDGSTLIIIKCNGDKIEVPINK